MDSGVSARTRGVFRTVALVIFMVTSAYLVLELVIALSAQGEPTGAVAPFTGAQVVYPDWYQAPEFLDAARVALLAYPVAALFYGIALMVAWIVRGRRPEQPRMLPDLPATDGMTAPEAAAISAAEPVDEDCIVRADRKIAAITLTTARLFGLAPRDMVGRSLELFLSPVDLPKLDALVAAAYADRPRAFATTVGILLPDAVVAAVDFTCRAGEQGAASVSGAIILTIRPFSERGRLDDQLAALWY